MRKASLDHIADGIGIEEIADGHLEQPALLWRSVFAIREEIFRNLSGLEQCEEIIPGFWPARKDDVTRPRIAPHIHLRALETIFRRKTDGLAASVAK